jgi:hypothetical protein
MNVKNDPVRIMKIGNKDTISWEFRTFHGPLPNPLQGEGRCVGLRGLCGHSVSSAVKKKLVVVE